jgi:hypothetical protein
MRWWPALLLWMPLATLASADPLDLRDARPRAISVAFEVSPTDRPGELDTSYSEALPAWIEPDSVPGRMRVSVPGAAMERLLADQDPLPGSFSDYVWIFDVASGNVLEAGFRGRLRRPVSMGLLAMQVETQIDVRVGTRDAIGFRSPRVRLGQIVVETCEPGTPDCTRMEPHPFDPRRGYVNAVGTIRAHALADLGAVTFAPLGEAVFSELPRESAVSLAR